MTNILVYDLEAEKLEQVAEDNDLTTAEVVEMLVEWLDDCKEENGWK